jgi:hypothetical protein
MLLKLPPLGHVAAVAQAESGAAIAQSRQSGRSAGSWTFWRGHNAVV